MKLVKASDIEWDTDNEVIDNLPDSVIIPSHIEKDDIADYLSDKYGFCVIGFNIELND